MKTKQLCPVCGGELKDTIITVDRRRGEKLIVFTNVPARVCEACSEKFIDVRAVRAMEKVLQEKPEPREMLQVPVYRLTA